VDRLGGVETGDRTLWPIRVPGHGPDGEFGPVLDLEFSENPIQIFFYGSLTEAKNVRDFLIQHGLSYQFHDLLFPEGKFRRER
jgi:hypothetical protein